MRSFLFIIFIFLIVPSFAQNDGIVPLLGEKTKLQLSEQARQSKQPFQFLITDVNKKIKYWQKDSVFVFFKKNVDSLINHYNDTVTKGGIPCRDSMWRVGNAIFHKNTMCNIQSISLLSDYTFSNVGTGSRVLYDTLNRQIKYRTLKGSGGVNVYEQGTEIIIESDTSSGCKGGRVYQKAAITDTIGLNPTPNCGDVFVAAADTCFDYLYIRGHTPSKWNLIGNYLKNVNCAVGQLHYNVGDGLGKSVKLSGVQDPDNARFRSIKGAGAISVKTIGDNIIVADSIGNLYIFENVGDGAFVIKDTTNKIIKIRSVKGLGCIKAVVNNDVIEVQDTCVAASDYKFRNDGTGIPVLKDTLNRIIKYLAVKGSGTVKVVRVGDDIIISDTFFHADTLQELNSVTSTNVEHKFQLDKDGTTSVKILSGIGTYFDNSQTGKIGIFRINVDTTINAFKKGNYAATNVGSGAGVYKNTTGFDPKTFNFKSLRSSDNSIAITGNIDEIDLKANVTIDNRDSIWHDASTSQLRRKDYAKGALIGQTTLTAGNGIAFSSPVSGPSGHIAIELDNNPACPTLPLGSFTGKYVMWDVNTQCMQIYSCGVDPCAPPPPAPPLIMGFETDETDIPLNSQFLTFDNILNKWVATDITNQPIGTYLGGTTQFLGIGGGTIPSGWIGEDFNIPVDYAPATSALDLGFHAIYINGITYFTGSGVTAPIIGTDDAAIQSFINAALITAGYSANDLIWVSNSDNTVTIWRNPSYTYNLNDFWMGDMTPNNYTNKYYPSTPTTHAPPTGGLALYTIPTEKRYQNFASAGATVDVTSGANTADGFVNLTAGDLTLEKSKIDVYINGLKHSYTASPSPSTYLSYTVSGSQITAYSGSSTIGINQIEVIIKP